MNKDLEKKLHGADNYSVGSILRGKGVSDEQMDKLKALDGRGKRPPRTYDWYPSDTEERFKQAPEDFQEYWNSKKHIMNYELNSYGMRCGQLEPERESILFLGCSMTFGVGCPKHQTWPYLVAKHFGLREYNLALPGGSLDAAFRLYLAWQRKLRSKVTILAVPPGYRLEKVTGVGPHPCQTLGVWNMPSDEDPKIQKEWITDSGNQLNDSNIYLNYNKNIFCIESIAKETDSLLHRVSWSNTKYRFAMGMKRARDRAHPDETWHEKIAQAVINELQDKL